MEAPRERETEIEESAPLLDRSTTEVETNVEASPSKLNRRSVKTKVPEVEVHLYRQGKGPIAVFKSTLGGWDQDQLEVRDILEQYGFKSLYAFNLESGRSAPIRFHPRTGRSMLPYKDGSVILLDGEPKDSMIKPITRILVGVAITTVLIVLVAKETPEWADKFNIKGLRIPPWILTCVVIVFARMRKRTKQFLVNCMARGNKPSTLNQE